MSTKTTATRAEAIAAAVQRYEGDDFLFHWEESEYIEGICQVIADTFGVTDALNARSEVWEEMRAAFEEAKRRERAQEIARRISGDVPGTMDPESITLDHADLIAALTEAVLAGMTEKENAA